MSVFGVVDCGSTKIQRLISVMGHSNDEVLLIPLAKANGYDFSRLDGVVISGGPHLFSDLITGQALLQTFKFIDSLAIPTLGICLGYQALALRHGGQVFLGAERRESEAIEIRAEHELFSGLPQRLSVREDHCEGITLPTEFQLLASSAFYEVEAIASRSAPLFGVQFHPEVSGDVGETIIHNFCNIARKH